MQDQNNKHGIGYLRQNQGCIKLFKQKQWYFRLLNQDCRCFQPIKVRFKYFPIG